MILVKEDMNYVCNTEPIYYKCKKKDIKYKPQKAEAQSHTLISRQCFDRLNIWRECLYVDTQH